MVSTTDSIICKGLVYECELGFHPYEKRLRQKITVDLQVSVAPPRKGGEDRLSSIQMDYYEANKQISRLLEKTKFKLIETVAESIAVLVLKNFTVSAVEVRVTKYPLDMPNMESVSYVCCRKKRGKKYVTGQHIF